MLIVGFAMTATSDHGHYLYSPSTRLQGDLPLSAGEVLHMANNLEHTYDERMQHRINWVSATSYLYSYSSADYEHAQTHVFPWTVRRDGTPATPIIRVGGAATSGTFYVYAAFIPHSHITPYYEWDSTHALQTWGASTASTSAAWMVSSYGDMSSFTLLHSLPGYTSRNSTEDDSAATATEYLTRFFLFRLSVYTKGSGYLHGVSLREFNG